MSHLNLGIGPWQVVWPRVVTICGVSMIFAPLNVAAFMYVPPELRAAAVGVLALLRNEGGSVGTSVAQTILERREQFHAMRLNEYLDRFNPAVAPYLQQATTYFYGTNGDPVASRDMALAALDAARQTQATSLAYFDVFWSLGAAACLLVLLILLMRRSVAARGAHIAAD
jgi:DHA2 family multidrug resistance protein